MPVTVMFVLPQCLIKYLRHAPECEPSVKEGYHCTCGLDVELDRLRVPDQSLVERLLDKVEREIYAGEREGGVAPPKES